jgi:PPOX class probable FMN-dependent enzyme
MDLAADEAKADTENAGTENTITDQDTLRERYGTPSELAVKKQLDHLDTHCRAFIALSPFVVIGTQGADGLGDVSPRGDAPGFVQVLDDRTLAIPDRLGNNRTDTLSNIIDNAGIGLLFMVPGMNETLRVNGRARIVTDEALLAGMEAQRRVPRSALVVEVAEAYLQCAKALVRSKLWDDDHKIERRSFPTLGKIIADQAGGGVDAEKAEEKIQESMRTRLY